jgi:NAD(P)-dependent dehydrogenase (short-subunit alcohol dehydrogenase family)
MAAAADVANPADMQTVVADARRRFGRIDGVIHAAGVAGGGIIQLKNRDEAARVLAPKVTGTEVLFRALGEAPLDFVVLCSSMTSMVGGAGQVDYCGANACLDAFAHAYARKTGTFTVAMNWDAWQEVGMAVETNIPEHLARQRAELLKRAILPTEGAEAFHRILTVETLPQVLVSPLPWSSRTNSRTARHEAAKPDSAASAAPESEAVEAEHGRPALSTDYVAPSDDIERAIVDIWQRMLGLSPVGTADDFFELGGHSLLALRITTRLRDDYGLDLSLRNQPVADREEIEIV